MSDPESTPAVVSYRVGQLETTQKEGFKTLNDKLDTIVQGFVTEKEMTEAKQNATEIHAEMVKQKDVEHAQLWAAIKEIKTNAKWWVGTIIATATVIIGFLSIRG